MAPVHRPSDRSSASIYALMDPDTHAVVYVGLTTRALTTRLHEHIMARHGPDRAHYAVSQWIQTLVDEQGRVPAVACLGLYPRHLAPYAELAWFRFYLRRGAGLLNAWAPLIPPPLYGGIRGRLSPADAGRLLQHGHGTWCPDNCLCWSWAWDCCLGCGEKACLRLPRCGALQTVLEAGRRRNEEAMHRRYGAGTSATGASSLAVSAIPQHDHMVQARPRAGASPVLQSDVGQTGPEAIT